MYVYSVYRQGGFFFKMAGKTLACLVYAAAFWLRFLWHSKNNFYILHYSVTVCLPLTGSLSTSLSLSAYVCVCVEWAAAAAAASDARIVQLSVWGGAGTRR